MESIPFWLAHYGYAGLAVLLTLGIIGLPIPDETLLAFAGHLIAKGKLALIPTIGTAFLGSVCGITISYALGRWTGHYFIEKSHRILRIDCRAAREGPRLVCSSREAAPVFWLFCSRRAACHSLRSGFKQTPYGYFWAVCIYGSSLLVCELHHPGLFSAGRLETSLRYDA